MINDQFAKNFYRSSENSNKGDYFKALLAFSLVLLASFTNALSLAWVHDRVPYGQRPLPDVWFDFFPVVYPRAIEIAEWIIVGSVSCLVVLIVFHKRSILLVRRLFTVASICYFCRAICICSTQLPVPSRFTYCSPASPNGSSNFSTLFSRTSDIYDGFGLNMFHERAFCGDLVYSGHTIILFLCFNMFRRYLPNRWAFLSHLSRLANVLALICILAARKHYTIDVVLAYWITSHVFWTYHALLAFRIGRSDDPDGQSCSRHIFWHFLFEFMEKNAPEKCVVENRFETPPLLRFLSDRTRRFVRDLQPIGLKVADGLDSIMVVESSQKII